MWRQVANLPGTDRQVGNLPPHAGRPLNERTALTTRPGAVVIPKSLGVATHLGCPRSRRSPGRSGPRFSEESVMSRQAPSGSGGLWLRAAVAALVALALALFGPGLRAAQKEAQDQDVQKEQQKDTKKGEPEDL